MAVLRPPKELQSAVALLFLNFIGERLTFVGERPVFFFVAT